MKPIFVGFALASILLFVPMTTLAQETKDIPALEVTVIPMSIPSNNKLPWGFVEGKITSPVAGHQAIIQIYKDNKPVHFAQVPVNDDGTYQYRFRALDITDGKTTRIFEGDYAVKVFKVVNLDSDYLDSYMKNKNSSLLSLLF
jgi:hypothetical protein